MSITYSACVFVAFSIQEGMRMLLTVILSQPARQYFSKFFRKKDDFSKKLLNIIFVFWFYLHVPETYLILRRPKWDMIIKIYWPSCKVPVILVRLQWNLNILDRIAKNTEI